MTIAPTICLSADQREAMNRDIPSDAVMSKDGASYVPGFYVFDELNQILGPDGWSLEVRSSEWPHPVEKFTKVKTDRQGVVIKSYQSFRAVARVTVRLSLVADPSVYRDGSACGSGESPSMGDACHHAIGEAETDATKRAARLLGRRLGLALYDKEQRFVSDQPEPMDPLVIQHGPKTGNLIAKAPVNWLEKHLARLETTADVDPAHLEAVRAEVARRRALAQAAADKRAAAPVNEDAEPPPTSAEKALEDLADPRDPSVFWYGVNEGKALAKAPTEILIRYLDRLEKAGDSATPHVIAVEQEIEKRLKSKGAR